MVISHFLWSDTFGHKLVKKNGKVAKCAVRSSVKLLDLLATDLRVFASSSPTIIPLPVSVPRTKL